MSESTCGFKSRQPHQVRSRKGHLLYARVVELADSLDSGSSVHYGRAGSSPASRTKKKDSTLCCPSFWCRPRHRRDLRRGRWPNTRDATEGVPATTLPLQCLKCPQIFSRMSPLTPARLPPADAAGYGPFLLSKAPKPSCGAPAEGCQGAANRSRSSARSPAGR